MPQSRQKLVWQFDIQKVWKILFPYCYSRYTWSTKIL